MKTIFTICIAITVLAGCSSNPVLTGKPQHWKGKPGADLRAALGEPDKITTQGDGSEVWHYINSGTFVAPEEENTSFGMRGGEGENFFGASGGLSTVRQPERVSRYENRARFLIRDGKVRAWYAERLVDGKIVWEDH